MLQSLPPSSSKLLVTLQQSSAFLSWHTYTQTHRHARTRGAVRLQPQILKHTPTSETSGRSGSTAGLEYLQSRSRSTVCAEASPWLSKWVLSSPLAEKRVKGELNYATVICSVFSVTAFESSGLIPSINAVSCFYLRFGVISASKWSKWLSVQRHMWFILN